MSQVDRVLHDVALVVEIGIDIDRRVGDEERAWIAWRVDREYMAARPAARSAVHDRDPLRRP